MSLQIKKRNGKIVDYDGDKIKNSIRKALVESEIQNLNIEEMLDDIEKLIKEYIRLNLSVYNQVADVEFIQNLIEEELVKRNLYLTVKSYILYRKEREEIRKGQLYVGSIGRDIYTEKYKFGKETFEEFLERVSGGNEYIAKLIRNRKFLPAGRVLAGRGLNKYGKKVCYANCFLITPPRDNLESIFDTAKKMARTYSMGGGCGTSLENLRPKGAKVNNSAETTSGAVSFMDLYSLTTGLIGMKGRRGALMLTMPVTHPDIMEFINVKNDLAKVTKANISIMVTDEFMKAVINNEDWHTRFECETGEVIERTIPANTILKQLSINAWNTAEPAILFWDRVNNYHINAKNPNFHYNSVNPCGEKPLVDEGSCLLSSFNLSNYVLNPFSENVSFDVKSFKEDILEVVRYMDDLLEEGIEFLPLPEQREVARKYRQLGIGIMGLADMLIKMGVKYGSQKSLDIVEDIMKVFSDTALYASSLLAKERGPYPEYVAEYVLDSPYIKAVASPETYESIKQYGLRNAELLSIAPTGSISTMIGVSGGIEPIFANVYTRKTESLSDDGEPIYYDVYTPIVMEYMEKFNLNSIEELPDFFVTAMDIDYHDRILMQSVIQKYVDSAISSTINLKESTTVDDVYNIFIESWKHGLKGITIYRDGCMRTGILSTKKINRIEKIDQLREEINKLALEELKENPEVCPLCGGKLNHTNGCEVCQDCGYSPCSV